MVYEVGCGAVFGWIIKLCVKVTKGDHAQSNTSGQHAKCLIEPGFRSQIVFDAPREMLIGKVLSVLKKLAAAEPEIARVHAYHEARAIGNRGGRFHDQRAGLDDRPAAICVAPTQNQYGVRTIHRARERFLPPFPSCHLFHRINLSKYIFLYRLGRFFSKDLVTVTRVEKSKDGLLVVSALGTDCQIKAAPFSSGRWELEIEPTAAWIVRKARFCSNAEPQRIWAGVRTEMINSGTVWSGPYCIPKVALINVMGPITHKLQTKRVTFDPEFGKFDEKLYSTLRQAVGYNKEPTLKVDDNRVSPPTFTEPNRPKPKPPQH